jgi:hypothetical protein
MLSENFNKLFVILLFLGRFSTSDVDKQKCKNCGSEFKHCLYHNYCISDDEQLFDLLCSQQLKKIDDLEYQVI